MNYTHPEDPINDENKKKLPKILAFTDEIFNMIWTAAFQSGAKVEHEIAEGLISSQFEATKRIQELINSDADGIMSLINLKKEMQ